MQSTDNKSAIVLEHQAMILPTELRIGHYVAQLDIPWSETRFPLQGIMVDSDKIKSWLTTHCNWVVIDLTKSATDVCVGHPGLAARQQQRIHAWSQASHPTNILRKTEVNRKTLKAALGTYAVLDRQVRRLMSAFSERGNLHLNTVNEIVHDLSETLEENISAMVWLTKIKQQDNYTAEHCINVAILSMGLAHALEWEPKRIKLAGVSGLLHDLGKMKLDMGVLNKPSRLTPEEFAHIKTHTTLGHHMVSLDPDIEEHVAHAILEHHERPDGRGYPYGKAPHEVNPISQLVGVVDAYDAITSDRVYDAARSHHEALGILWKERDKQFDTDMVEVFIQFMGWVTPGTLVRLSDGTLAVVMQTRLGQRLNPVVRQLTTEGTTYKPGALLDLANQSDDAEATLRIEKVLPDGAEGVDIRQLLRSVVV